MQGNLGNEQRSTADCVTALRYHLLVQGLEPQCPQTLVTLQLSKATRIESVAMHVPSVNSKQNKPRGERGEAPEGPSEQANPRGAKGDSPRRPKGGRTREGDTRHTTTKQKANPFARNYCGTSSVFTDEWWTQVANLSSLPGDPRTTKLGMEGKIGMRKMEQN